MESNGEVESSVCRSNDGGCVRDRRVGLIFDERMCKHYAPNGEDHPECPDRIRVIWELLNSTGLAKRCIILNAKDAEDNHLALVHTKNHIDLIKNISSRNSKSKRKRIAAKFNSIYFNEGSSEAAYLAAGSVIEAAEKVAKGELNSAFAIVRPPGHHAEEGEPMGFCLYNNVGIATSYLLNERRDLGINKILIVDWDVHHGNGTQKMFYNDPRVLLFSVHRYDFGTFYPAGHDGSYIMTGEEAGAGHNINVPWEHGRCGDADYLAVWDHILIPVAKEFDPNMIFISAGFDAAIGDPLGGCRISPYGYSIMLDKLMEFAGGKIVMALEGGYNLNSIASSARACVEVLLHEKPPNVVPEAYPFAATWRVIQEVRRELSSYWPVLAAELPGKIISKTTQMGILSYDSEAETEDINLNVSEEVQTIEDVTQPFTNLKVDSDGQVNMYKQFGLKKKASGQAPAGEKGPKKQKTSSRTELPLTTTGPIPMTVSSSSAPSERTLEGGLQMRGSKPFVAATAQTLPSLEEEVGTVADHFGAPIAQALEWPENFAERVELLSGLVTSELKKCASKHRKLERSLAKAKDDAAKKASEAKAFESALSRATAKAAKAEAEAKAAKAEMELLKKQREEDAASFAATQVDVLRAYTEKLFMSSQLAGFVNNVVRMLNKNSSRGPDVVISLYAREVAARLQTLPLLDALVSSPVPLTAEAVRACSVDRCEKIERAFAAVGPVSPAPFFIADESDEEEEEAGTRGGWGGEVPSSPWNDVPPERPGERAESGGQSG